MQLYKIPSDRILRNFWGNLRKNWGKMSENWGNFEVNWGNYILIPLSVMYLYIFKNICSKKSITNSFRKHNYSFRRHFLRFLGERERAVFWKFLKNKNRKRSSFVFYSTQPGPSKNPSKITNRFSFKEK